MRLMIAIGTAVVAAFMIFMGFQKFTGPNPVFSYIAEQSGIDLFEPGVRLLTGVAELGAGALLLAGFAFAMARTGGLLLSMAVLAGALVFHLSPWLGINAPVAFDEAGGYVKSPVLFIVAMSFFVISAGLAYLDRAQSKAA